MTSRRRLSAQQYHGGMALLFSLSGAGLLLLLIHPGSNLALYFAAWLLSVNVVTFGYYGFDKGRAGGTDGRVPEVVLHGLAFAGGSLGAYAGMRTFRHKTIKGSFRIVFWFIVILQIVLIAAVISRVVWP